MYYAALTTIQDIRISTMNNKSKKYVIYLCAKINETINCYEVEIFTAPMPLTFTIHI